MPVSAAAEGSMKQTDETTRILFDTCSDEYGAFVCEACGKVMKYNFRFKRCPYCKRKVVYSDVRMGMT